MKVANDFSQFTIAKIELPELMKKARDLDNKGVVIRYNDYYFLKLDDDFIHKLYPELAWFADVEKPDYFNQLNSTGAHITIAYPEEGVVISEEDLEQVHAFEIKELCSVKLGAKEAFVLFVESESLVSLRAKYDLSKILSYKNHKIDLHITIGMRYL